MPILTLRLTRHSHHSTIACVPIGRVAGYSRDMDIPTRLIAMMVVTLAAAILHDCYADTAPPPADKGTHLELGLGIAGAHFPDDPGASLD